MLHRAILAAALAAGLSSAAQAQVPQVVPTCGASSGLAMQPGPGGRITVSPDGTLCTTASTGGGSGSAATITPSAGAQQQDVAATRTLDATSTSSQQVYATNGQGTLSFTLSGLTASGATIAFEQSNDWNGTTGTWTAISEVNTGTSQASTTRATDGQSAIGIEGTKAIRFRVATAGTGTITLATNIAVPSRYVGLRGPALTGQYNATPPTLSTGQFAAVTLDANGRPILAPSTTINVVQSGTWSETVTGTVTANIGTTNGLALDATLTARLGTLGQKTAAGSAPVVLASDQPAVPVTGTFFQATQPISAAALPLPAGAATAAKQAAPGTAGTPSADVITVQGAANGTPQPVTNTPALGATLTTSQPSVTTTAALISAAATYNSREVCLPPSATASIFLGASGVTTTTGYELFPGGCRDFSRFSGALFAVAASTQTARLVSY